MLQFSIKGFYGIIYVTYNKNDWGLIMKKTIIFSSILLLCIVLISCNESNSSNKDTIEEPHFFDLIDTIWDSYVVEAFFRNELSIDDIEEITFIGYRYQIYNYFWDNQIGDHYHDYMTMVIQFNSNVDFKNHVLRWRQFNDSEYAYFQYSENIDETLQMYRNIESHEYNQKIKAFDNYPEETTYSNEFIDETYKMDDIKMYIPEVNLYEEDNIIYILKDNYAILAKPNQYFDPNTEELTIPRIVNSLEVTEIEYVAFMNYNLINVSLPDSMKIIGQRVFFGNNLTSIIIPDQVTTIDTFAFSENNLTNVVISKSVTSIFYNAFYDNQITNITILGDEIRFNDQWTNIGFPEELKPE